MSADIKPRVVYETAEQLARWARFEPADKALAHCPRCSAPLLVPASTAAQAGDCPSCGAAITVPGSLPGVGLIRFVGRLALTVWLN